MKELDDATLVAFVDGELGPTACHEIAAQVAQDPETAEKVRLLRASASLVRAAFADPRYQVVPPGLAERLSRPARRNPIQRRTLGLAAAASIAALVVAAGGGAALREAAVASQSPDDGLLADIAEYHVVYAQEGSDFGAVPAVHAAKIEAFLRKLLHRPTRIPDLSQFGFTFQAARLLAADDRPVVQLLYRRPGEPKKPLGLCITPGMPQHASLYLVHHHGVTLARWGERGLTYVLVGWSTQAALARLATHLRPRLATL